MTVEVFPSLKFIDFSQFGKQIKIACMNRIMTFSSWQWLGLPGCLWKPCVSLVCNMPQCSDHDHNVETGDVTRPVMMPHSSCDTDITPETNFLQTKQICRNLLPRRIHKIIPRLFPRIVFIKRRSFVFILRWLFHDHDSPSQNDVYSRGLHKCGPHHADVRVRE